MILVVPIPGYCFSISFKDILSCAQISILDPGVIPCTNNKVYSVHIINGSLKVISKQ